MRKYRSKKVWKKIVTDWKVSGLSGTDYSKQIGIHHTQLYRWDRRFRAEDNQQVTEIKLPAPEKTVKRSCKPVIKIGKVELHSFSTANYQSLVMIMKAALEAQNA